MSRYLVTDKDGNGHLPVRDADDGPLNHHLMGAAWAALHGGYRGNRYEGPDKEKAIEKLKALYRSEGMELPSDASESSIRVSQNSELKALNSPRHLAVLLNGPGRPIDHRRSTTGNLYEVPIAVMGNWVKDGHRFSITLEDLHDMVRNFAKRKNDQVVIDYEHASEQPAVAKGGPIPAAGWIHELGLREQGPDLREGSGPLPSAPGPYLFALVEWTPEAERLIRSGHYRFFSPSIDWGARDKQTGEPQGATLTSGALTNHPFLEELPPIMLTDLDWVPGREVNPEKGTRCGTSGSSGVKASGTADGAWNQPGKAASRDDETGKGEKKMAKRLSMKRLEAGEHEGHLGVFDGQELMGYVPLNEFADLAREHLGINPDAEAREREEKRLTELLRESGVGSVEGGRTVWEQTQKLLRRLAELERQEEEGARRRLLLGTVVKEGVVEQGKARELAGENRITLADYIAVQEAEQRLEEAVREGKILPRERGFFFRDALERPEEFAAYVERAVRVVPLGVRGLGSGEGLPVDEEVDLGVKRVMSEQKLSYGKALKQLFKEEPGLEARYRAAHCARVTPDTPVSERAGAGMTQ